MTVEIDVRKTLGDFAVDARFRAGSGVTALFGKSGAGKTSIVQMVAGLLAPDAGRISVADEVLFDAARGIDVAPERRRVGCVFQDARLFPHMTVRRNLEFGARRSKRLGIFGIDAVADVLGIERFLERRTHGLSGGERQRVAIGRALLSAPSLLLMDEPLASLDAERKHEIIPFIDRVRRRFAVPIVYVSHAVEEILRLADEMVLLESGSVAASGPVEDVLNRPRLARIVGDGDAGTVIPVEVSDPDDGYGIATLSFAGGAFRIVSSELCGGERLRIRVRARDVSLALVRPRNVSVLNVFEGRVAEIAGADRPQVDVSVRVGGILLWSRLTRRSLHDLSLAPGTKVYAMVKAVAIDRPASNA